MRSPVRYRIPLVVLPFVSFASFVSAVIPPVFSVIAALTLALAAVDAAAEVGRVKVSTGVVHIERGGQHLPAPVGTPLDASDTLVTGANSTVGVTFVDNTRMAAGSNTVLSINRFVFDPTTHVGALDATVKRGTLAVISGKLAKQSPEAVSFRTPSMVMGVRGTEFVVYAGE